MDPIKRMTAKEAYLDPWVQEFATVEKEKSLSSTVEALKNMQKYHTESKIQQAIYLMMVDYMTTQDEKDRLMMSFQSLDTNGDGVLSKEELTIGNYTNKLLISGFEKVMHLKIGDDFVQQILDRIDNN